MRLTDGNFNFCRQRNNFNFHSSNGNIHFPKILNSIFEFSTKNANFKISFFFLEKTEISSHIFNIQLKQTF